MLSKPVNGATYTLTNNVTLASNVNMNPARKGTSFTIDLNGYNITLNGNNGCTVAKDTTLTVTDFSKTGSGSMTHTGSGYMFLANRDVTFILNDKDNRCTTSGKGLITNL